MTICQHLVYFGVHGSSAGGYIIYLICNVTSHEQLIDRAWEFTGENSLCYVTTLIRIVNITIATVEI